jgi:uncharacterized protein (TIGR02611 family)
MVRRIVIGTLKQAWRLIILVVGASVLLFGVALLFLPGPAFVVIPVGLAILATEFAWARRLLHHVKQKAAGYANQAFGTKTSRPEASPRPD